MFQFLRIAGHKSPHWRIFARDDIRPGLRTEG
jgi:hypothetical protein